MPSQYGGLPASVENNLPPAVAILSTTNATPIVVTTFTPHRLKPGDYLITIGAQDPNAVGIFIAGAITSTTVALLAAPAGTSVAGSMAGGAQGTLQPTGFGVTYALPSDLTDPRSAASINVALEALGDRTAFLLHLIHFGRKRRRPRNILTDANHIIGVEMADCFQLPAAPAAMRLIILSTGTGPAPRENERIEVVTGGGLAAGQMYRFQREDTTMVAEFWGNSAGNACIAAQFELSGGDWRLGLNPGYDVAASSGVLAGPGA